MKRNSFLQTTTLTVLAFLALAACQAWAGTLSHPWGVAIDASGNIYVANSATNQVLVFDVNRVLQPKKTITAGLANPNGLAFDSKGNLWVANYGNTGYDSSITEYNSKGQQITGATITQNLQFTEGLAIDSMNNIWALGALDASVTIYSPFGTYLGSSAPGYDIWSVASRGKWVVFTTTDEWVAYSTGEVLRNAVTASVAGSTPGHTGAVGFDNVGNFYVCQADGEVDYVNLAQGVASVFTQLGGYYGINGIAVDNAHSRVYFQSTNNSAIYVFTTAGIYVGVIN